MFLAGATGVIGRLLAPMLIEADHYVVGTTRSPARAEAMRAPGLEMILVDMLDAAAVRAALISAAPDLVIHQLTDLAGGLAWSMDRAVRANARLRREATPNLIRGMLDAGVSAIVAQSIAWAYSPGDGPRREDDPLDGNADGLRGVTVDGVLALERAVLGTGDIEGTVLRYGHLYGGGTGVASPDGDCTVHVEAAAHAALLAAAEKVPGVYNIADPGPSVSSARAARILGWHPSFRVHQPG